MELNGPIHSFQDRVSQYQGAGDNIIDTSMVVDHSLRLNVEIAKDSNFNHRVGLYEVINSNGDVRDPLTGAIVQPQDGNYAAVVLSNSYPKTDLLSAPLNSGEMAMSQHQIDSSKFYAPFVTVFGDSSETTYFAFPDANGNAQHIISVGTNQFAIEDSSTGNADFNDLIVSMNFNFTQAPFAI